ncbi:hypothetical protein B0H21DRAFT_780458 [Amylocystis lapponica]|nr:hypothetical protein B0H21DRAFT_780458 [Amylocystis lapponica]
MLAITRSLAAPSSAARTFINFYSTVSGLSRKKWRTGSHPAPPSLVKDDYDSIQADDDAEPERVAPKFLRRKPSKIPTPHEFAAHRMTMKSAFPQGWMPPRKISREAMDGMRSMHAVDPSVLSTAVLAEKFRISPEAVRRILKSKWEPTREQRVRMAERERRSREQWIRQRREEERRKHEESERANGVPVRGRIRNDKLSLT